MASTVQEIMAAIADQLRDTLEDLVDGIQVEPDWVASPTPPTVDVFPATEFQNRIGFGVANNELNFTVRARVNTPDGDAARNVLLELLDPNAATSIAAIIEADPTLGNEVESAVVKEGPTGYNVYNDAQGVGAYIGSEMVVTVLP